MNILKNDLFNALELLGENPKRTDLKKDLEEKFNYIYKDNINHLIFVLNYNMYDLIKQLVNANDKGIDISDEYQSEIEFLQETLIISIESIKNHKMHIAFQESMKEKFTSFINDVNYDKIRRYTIATQFLINYAEAYGIMKCKDAVDILNNMANLKLSLSDVTELLKYNVELRKVIDVIQINDEIYFRIIFLDNPNEILKERKKRNLTYKEINVRDFGNYSLAVLMTREESLAILNFFKKKKLETPEMIIAEMIAYILIQVEPDMKGLLEFADINFSNDKEINDYLQLLMNLYNNLPHYCLYGYSPKELTQLKIEQYKEQESATKKNKIGRNDPCPCGSGKKYKNCCLNKVVQVDFSHHQYNDCISEDDAKLFFELRNLLFLYVNKKYKINPDIRKMIDINLAEPSEMIDIRNKLWTDSNVLKNYIKENPDSLNNEELSILADWDKKKLYKEYTIYKYEPNYAVFLDDNYIYYVKGLKETIRNILSEDRLPTFAKTVLLPFKGCIVYDSYLEMFNISFGPGIRKMANETYERLLKQNKIKCEL